MRVSIEAHDASPIAKCKPPIKAKALTFAPMDLEIQKFFESERIGLEQSEGEEDEQILLEFRKNLFSENGRYQVALPWNKSKLNLPTNKRMART